MIEEKTEPLYKSICFEGKARRIILRYDLYKGRERLMYPQLLFVYIKELRNCFNQQEFCFTNDFDISFSEDRLLIEKKRNPYNKLWGENISNINLIVGKNGAGKSTLLDLLGSTKSSRLNLLRKPKATNKENGSFSEWFALYHIEDNIFVIEGNNPNLLKNLEQLPKLTSDEYSICVKYDFSEKIVKYFEYIQYNEYTWERTPYSLDRKMHALYMTNNVKKGWYLDNQIRNEQDHFVGFKRRYLNNPLYSNIYRFMSQDYKVLEKNFTAKNAVCEIERDEHYDLFYEEDLINTLEFKLYNDNSEIFLFKKNDILSALFNKDKKNELGDWSVKEKYIIKFLELRVLGLWVNLGRNKLNDSEKEDYIDNVESILYNKDDFHGRVDYLIQVLHLLYKSLNSKVFLERQEFEIEVIKNITKMVMNIKESFFVSDQLISIVTNNGFEESIHDFLHFFDKLNENEIYIDIKIRFKNMSSGELEFVNGFANLYSAIQMAMQNKEIDTLLLLLDEPDASFHPEWSRRYIHNICNFLNEIDYGKNFKYQIIITTHSPFIVSDVPKEYITCIKIQEDGFGEIQRIVGNADFGFMSNFYDIIQGDFFITSPIGEHAKYLFEKTVRRITSWKEYDENEIESVNGIISAIGEDVIRAKLQQLLNDKKTELLPNEEKFRKINALEQELKILKKTMGETTND